jgi:hypothetical protein
MLKKYNSNFLSALLIAFVLSSCSYKHKITAENIILDPIYSSNMVFKRGDTIAISGSCNPGGVLAVKLQDGLKYVTADDQGRWLAVFPPMSFKGAYIISFEGVNQFIELKNLINGKVVVVVGDSWLQYLPKEISEKELIKGIGSNKKVRIYSPGLIEGNHDSHTEWKEQDISAKYLKDHFAAYLGEKIAFHTSEPVGIVNLAYPGTSLLNFTDSGRKTINEEYPSVVRDSIWKEYFDNLNNYRNLADSSYRGMEKEVLNRLYDDWEWSEVDFPLITARRRYMKNKIVWLRKKVFITSKHITSPFKLNLGPIRGEFDVYFNGTRVEQFSGESEEFNITIPDSLVKVWANLITIRMVCGDSLSGLYSEKPEISNSNSSFSSNIKNGWRIRAYYEPALPSVYKPVYLWPEVYENYLKLTKGIEADLLILTGGVHQYSRMNEDLLFEALGTFENYVNSDKNFLFLLHKPGSVEAWSNSNYFNNVRNMQLLSAAERDWSFVNTLAIDAQEPLPLFYNNLSLELINSME